MKTYLVGGAVRDLILKRDTNDKDYVVVGSTVEEMLSLGFKQVGSEFPVFLHPETKDEYALARIEVSTGDGHKDFKFDFNQNVSLEQDLYRRDLTINAIAMDDDGNFIDPYNGFKDIKSETLRHISAYFSDDPLRVLRVCRFSAQLEFGVEPETIKLMAKMTRDGMLKTLALERIYKELEKALMSVKPRLFFDVLNECNALKAVFGEIYNLLSTKRKVYDQLLNFLDLCNQEDITLEVRLAGLAMFINQGNSFEDVEQFYNRLRMPLVVKNLAMGIMVHHIDCDNIQNMTPTQLVKFIDSLISIVGDNPKFINKFGQCCSLYYLTKGFKNYRQQQYLKLIYKHLCKSNIVKKTKHLSLMIANNEITVEQLKQKKLDVKLEIASECIRKFKTTS